MIQQLLTHSLEISAHSLYENICILWLLERYQRQEYDLCLCDLRYLGQSSWHSSVREEDVPLLEIQTRPGLVWQVARGYRLRE